MTSNQQRLLQSLMNVLADQNRTLHVKLRYLGSPSAIRSNNSSNIRVEALVAAAPTHEPYDVHGASIYVIVIIAIYALTIVVMIGATMNDRSKSRIVESQVAYYLESPDSFKRQAEKLRAKLSAAPSPQPSHSYLRLPQIEEVFESTQSLAGPESV